MTEINLLPWREARREREKKQFSIYFALGMAAALAVVFLMYSYSNYLIENQTTRNQILEEEINKLKSQIKSIEDLKKVRQALIARMTVVRNLQATRSLTVRMFDELIKIMPDGVFLTNVERNGDKIILLGYAESNSNISQLMRNIESNPWIENPELTEIKKTKDEEAKPGEKTADDSVQVENQFKLSFVLRKGKL